MSNLELQPSRHWDSNDRSSAKDRRVGQTAIGDGLQTFGWPIRGLVTCLQCGGEFEAASIRLPSRTIKPTELCETCTPSNGDEKPDYAASWKLICPDEIFRDARYVQYIPDKIQTAFRDWFYKDRPKGRGLYAVGPTGSFKSTMMWYVVMKLHFAGRGVAAYTINRLADEIADSFTVQGAHGGLIHRLSMAEYLFIDDIDKAGIAGRTQAPPSLAKAIFDIVDARYRKGKPTLITTNMRRAEIVEIYGEQHGDPICRRLQNTSTIIETARLMPVEHPNNN